MAAPAVDHALTEQVNRSGETWLPCREFCKKCWPALSPWQSRTRACLDAKHDDDCRMICVFWAGQSKQKTWVPVRMPDEVSNMDAGLLCPLKDSCQQPESCPYPHSEAELAFWRQTARQNSMLTGGSSNGSSSGLLDAWREAGIFYQTGDTDMNSYAQLQKHQSGDGYEAKAAAFLRAAKSAVENPGLSDAYGLERHQLKLIESLLEKIKSGHLDNATLEQLPHQELVQQLISLVNKTAEQPSDTFVQSTAGSVQLRSDETKQEVAPETQAAFVKAVLAGQIRPVRSLLAQYKLDVNATHFNCPLLHWAAFSQYAKVHELLLNGGADTKSRDCDGQTALHVAFHQKARSKSLRLQIVTALLRRDCDPNAQDVEGRTALHHAVDHGDLECVRKLLAAGADPSIATEQGITPAMLALRRAESSHGQANAKRVVDLLRPSMGNTKFTPEPTATPEVLRPIIKVFAKFPRGAILPINQVVDSIAEKNGIEKHQAQAMIVEAVQLEGMHFIPDGTAQPKLALALDARVVKKDQPQPGQNAATAAVAAFFASEGQHKALHGRNAFKSGQGHRRNHHGRSRSEAFMSMAGSANSQDSYHPPSLDYTSHVDRPRLPFQDNLAYEPAFSVRPQREVVDEPTLSNTEPPNAAESVPVSPTYPPQDAQPGPTPAPDAGRVDASYRSMTAAFNYLSTDVASVSMPMAMAAPQATMDAWPYAPNRSMYPPHAYMHGEHAYAPGMPFTRQPPINEQAYGHFATQQHW
eukprot:TRINITY_DN12185_c0_g2_i10.p1 TRINITY_DN12185_c0_g2~~TRINITY_DN12185_c0_g2_i10.p1  ORF type:complete len:753 (+),score=126.58 TRINITY_DN12185_c0_g2_i10:41-2299(+)